MDMATLANAPRSVTIGDRVFLVSALNQYEWGEFQAWIKDFVPRPDPPADADNIERALYRRAWPPSIGSKMWIDAMDHPGCFPKLIHILLSKHQSDISYSEAIYLALEILEQDLVIKLLSLALGSEASLDESRDDEPKESAPDRPEDDNPGAIYHILATRYGWSHDDIMRMSHSQIGYYRHMGQPPRRGVKTFNNSAAARIGE